MQRMNQLQKEAAEKQLTQMEAEEASAGKDGQVQANKAPKHDEGAVEQKRDDAAATKKTDDDGAGAKKQVEAIDPESLKTPAEVGSALCRWRHLQGVSFPQTVVDLDCD